MERQENVTILSITDYPVEIQKMSKKKKMVKKKEKKNELEYSKIVKD